MPDANVIIKKLREGFILHLIMYTFSSCNRNVKETKILSLRISLSFHWPQSEASSWIRLMVVDTEDK